jgi:hypothetical protein
MHNFPPEILRDCTQNYFLKEIYFHGDDVDATAPGLFITKLIFRNYAVSFDFYLRGNAIADFPSGIELPRRPRTFG